MPTAKLSSPQHPKPATHKPYVLAFAFPDGQELQDRSPVVHSTEVIWSADGHAHLLAMHNSLKVQKGKNKVQLPIRDLRLRLQLNDPLVRRLDKALGTKSNPKKPVMLLYSGAERPTAEKAANDAVLVWVRDVVRPKNLEGLDQNAAQALQDLATKGLALRAVDHEAHVFTWKHHDANQSVATDFSTTQYADLADYVASLLAGQAIFGAEPGPLRREVTSELNSNYARLLTDPLRYPAGKGEIAFSLGVTISVETYPGRPLPVVQVAFGKRVWASSPTDHLFNNLSGYALPIGEHRALRFDVLPNLGLDTDYHAIARKYGLPLPRIGQESVTAKTLARDGREALGDYEKATVFITHRNGRGEKKPAQAGMPNQDKADAFERMAAVLAPYHLTPWRAVEEVKTKSHAPEGADESWRLFDTDYQKPAPKKPKPGAQPKSPKKVQAEADAKLDEAVAWRTRMQDDVRTYYHGGPYRLVLGYQDGQQASAEHAKTKLQELLGPETILVELFMLPDGVHGNRYHLEGKDEKSAEKRADLRTARWKTFVQGVTKREQELTEQAQKQSSEKPVDAFKFDGVLVLAHREYAAPTPKNPKHVGQDDKVNKRAGRLALMLGLKLPAQYLLPPNELPKKQGADWAEFNRRVVNAWRDLAWKFRGYAPNLAQRIQEALPTLPATSSVMLLSFGVLRSNRKGNLQNEVSFIPYALELNPATNTARAALLLTSKKKEPESTGLLPMPEAVHLLTHNGSSFLRHGGRADYELSLQRKQLTQRFIYNLIDEVAAENAQSEVVVLFDQRTLMSSWDWLSDQRLNPADVNFGQLLPSPEPRAQLNWPNVIFMRLRSDHAPKAMRSADRTVLKTLDGKGERLATWHCHAQLLKMQDSQRKGLTTYFSFGGDLDTSRIRGASCYRQLEKADGNLTQLHTKRWGTPSALEITVVGPTDPTDEPRFAADDLATLAEALRFDHAHAAGWTALPVPLHFASMLRQYVPDYEMTDDHDDEEADEVDEQE